MVGEIVGGDAGAGAAAGAAVGEVLAITESPGFAAPVAVRAAALSKGTPVQAGSQELRVDVSVTYRLVDR